MKKPIENEGHQTDKFYSYYEDISLTEKYIHGARSLSKMLLRTFYKYNNDYEKSLIIADIGCGVGTHSIIMAKEGHQVYGIDINESLLNLAQERARFEKLNIEFKVGSANLLPWPDNSMDITFALELIEHIPDWEKCIAEFTRILRKGGLLCVTTTNKLCPIQYEFKLPLYSWYPGFVKKKIEKLSVTSHPRIVEYAKYPAVNWFTYYKLKNHLSKLNFKCFDRFDVIDPSSKGVINKLIIYLLQNSKYFKFIGYFLIPGTMVVAIKQ